MIASPVAFFRAGGPLPLLDEEVDRDRHHRPDAGHHQREEAADRRGDQERNQPGLSLLGDLALNRTAARPAACPGLADALAVSAAFPASTGRLGLVVICARRLREFPR